MDEMKLKALYEAIDKTTANHYQTKKKKPPCAKGCASCCSQFFEVSKLEYAVIDGHIKTLPEATQALFRKRAHTLQSVFKEHYATFFEMYFKDIVPENFDDAYYRRKERYEVMLPCVFLSKEGACEIYDVRPLVCRTTGVGFTRRLNTGAVCGYIKLGLFTPLWQANLMAFSEAIEGVRWQENSIQLPLLFWHGR